MMVEAIPVNYFYGCLEISIYFSFPIRLGKIYKRKKPQVPSDISTAQVGFLTNPPDWVYLESVSITAESACTKRESTYLFNILDA